MNRIFHPVGQGAFFSEHFHDGSPVNVVYDCGALPFDKKFLEMKVHSSFRKNDVIDILFISHFHADHTNGIQFLKNHCTIKNVVIPYIDDEAKALYKIVNYLEAGYTETQLIDDPEVFFGGNTRIIRVRPFGENGAGEINPDLFVEINPEGGIRRSDTGNSTSGQPSGSIEIESGTPIRVSLIPTWFFVPYNYKQSARLALFEVELRKFGLAITDIDTINKIQRHETDITAAYRKVTGDLNKNSLFLYSGPKTQQGKIYYTAWPIPLWFYESPMGCLYTGDTDLNEGAIVNTLLASLSRLADNIGTVVVPHHGAIKNYDRTLLVALQEVRFCVVSYGTTNHYGHPSDHVIADILTRNRFLIRVTELQDSLAVFKSLL